MTLDNLLHNLKLLKKQIAWLEISYQRIEKIGLKPDYSIDEFGIFETACGRFSRSIDFLIRKMFRSIDAYEFENQGTLVDVINHAHKRNLFADIHEIRIMKDIRNTISHEYVEEALIEVFKDVLEYIPNLLQVMNNTVEYVEKNAKK